jgi:hypothetical protein
MDSRIRLATLSTGFRSLSATGGELTRRTRLMGGLSLKDTAAKVCLGHRDRGRSEDRLYTGGAR